MSKTLYASFVDAALAVKASGALLDEGVRKEDISVISKETGNSTDPNHPAQMYTQNRGIFEKNTNDRVMIENTANTSNNLNPSVVRDENMAGISSDPNHPTEVYSQSGQLFERNADEREKTENTAKHGLSTTTSGDAAVGAAKGAGIGLGVGIIAALAAIFIPGVGLVIGGGALATAVAAAVGTTVAGAVVGGVDGYLIDQGVPQEAAIDYNHAYENGGAVLAVHVPSNSVDEFTVQSILAKYNASNVSTYPDLAVTR